MLVSICIPAYNNAPSLKRCLDSVFSQTYPNFEVIVTDDSSTNEVHRLMADYADPRLIYKKNAVALGSPGNWNYAIEQAKGTYIKMLHHDDYFSGNDALARFVDHIKRYPGVAFVFCQSMIHFLNDGSHFVHKPTATQLRRIGERPDFLFFRNVIGAPSATCFRNDPSVQFDKRYKWLVDVDFYVRYLQRHPQFCYVPEALVTIVAGEQGQITEDVSVNAKLVINENLSLFASIYEPRLNRKKSRLFFEELFAQFGISSWEQLEAAFDVPAPLNDFLKAVFASMPRNKWWKRLSKRVLTSRYNKRIFKLERF